MQHEMHDLPLRGPKFNMWAVKVQQKEEETADVLEFGEIMMITSSLACLLCRSGNLSHSLYLCHFQSLGLLPAAANQAT